MPSLPRTTDFSLIPESQSAHQSFCFPLLRAPLLALTVMASLFSFDLVAKETENWEKNLVVSVDSQTDVKAQLLETLASVVPPTKGEQVIKSSDGRYILCGDLFRQKKAYALVELSGEIDLGFAAWNGKKWDARGLWKIGTIWRPKGWKSSSEDYLPCTPAERPFWTKELSGDGVPEVVVAGEVDKYFQEFYLFAFDPESRNLRLVQESMAEPQFAQGYLRLDYDSGRRSIWSQSDYYRWVDGKIVSVADWRDEVPYNDPEDSFWKVTTYNSHGKETEDFVIKEEGSEKENESAYVVTENEKPFAKVMIRWKKSLIYAPSRNEMEQAFFFEKLTKIPRALFPKGSDGKAPQRLEDAAKVTVTGNPEAVKRLSPIAISKASAKPGKAKP